MTAAPGTPHDTPMTEDQPGIDVLLAAARSGLDRLPPARAQEAVRGGGLIVDIRSELQRERDGCVPGARFVPRNVLEWRADPRCPHRDPALVAVRGPLILMCAEGYQSSLAAATLVLLGVAGATDMEGGYERWMAEGFPTSGARRSPGAATRPPAARPDTAPRHISGWSPATPRVDVRRGVSSRGTAGAG